MSNDQTASIRWAIEELSKQKDEIESKISVARKRDDTSDLIKEVLAQKDALHKRISALEDGLMRPSSRAEILLCNASF